ncbi:MAG: tripartite tricarboxylate transporter substrate-binding protein [Beijerinckiaceae bacterium]|nr:tripartite tricarboxylate transporter substrate-binding protein [Beijerinckiaceae bacterium]
MTRRTFYLAAALAVSACAGAQAQTAEDFYKGQKLSWILSAGEGGGYSTYARFFAPIFAQKIPGNPNIVIQNMPGAGGIRAMMHLANVAPRDGSVIGLVHASVPFAPLYGTKGANFDPRQMSWIGSISTESAMCVAWSSARINNWKDLFEVITWSAERAPDRRWKCCRTC